MLAARKAAKLHVFIHTHTDTHVHVCLYVATLRKRGSDRCDLFRSFIDKNAERETKEDGEGGNMAV